MRSYTCCTTSSTISLNIEDVAKTLKLLGEPNRLRIMCALNTNKEHCVCEIEEHLPDLSQSLLSHHLADLREAGLVVTEKRGLRVYYRLTAYGENTIQYVLSIKREETK